MANKDLAYYLALPYTINIRQINDESGSYYYASVVELDGCHSHGDSAIEAYEMVRDVLEGHIEVKIEHGDSIPEPMKEDDFSGKFVLRMPKTLHRQLSEQAAIEKVSLNQYCLYKLSSNSYRNPSYTVEQLREMLDTVYQNHPEAANARKSIDDYIKSRGTTSGADGRLRKVAPNIYRDIYNLNL